MVLSLLIVVTSCRNSSVVSDDSFRAWLEVDSTIFETASVSLSTTADASEPDSRAGFAVEVAPTTGAVT